MCFILLLQFYATMATDIFAKHVFNLIGVWFTYSIIFLLTLPTDLLDFSQDVWRDPALLFQISNSLFLSCLIPPCNPKFIWNHVHIPTSIWHHHSVLFYLFWEVISHCSLSLHFSASWRCWTYLLLHLLLICHLWSKASSCLLAIFLIGFFAFLLLSFEVSFIV